VYDVSNQKSIGFSCTAATCSGLGFGSGEGQFSVVSVAIDSTGNVYVGDASINHRVQKFDSSGTFLRMWGWGVDDGSNEFQICTSGCQAGISGSGDGQFFLFGPQGVAVDSADNVYVADSGNDRIQKFDSSGTFLDKWGSPGSGDGQFNSPRGVAVDSSGNVHVAESSNHRVQEFDSSGTFLRMWGWGVDDGSNEFQICTSGCQGGIFGSGDGQFFSPRDVAVDLSGNVYVADSGNDRIQKFDSSGTFLTKWGTNGAGDGQFDNTGGVAVDFSGNVYVADFSNARIQKFTEQQNFCGTNTLLVDGECGLNLDSICEAGTIPQGNGCVPDLDSICGGGTILQGNECVVDPTLTVISENTILQASTTVLGDVLIQSNALFTIPTGVTLTVPEGHKILLKTGAALLVEDGGTVILASGQPVMFEQGSGFWVKSGGNLIVTV